MHIRQAAKAQQCGVVTVSIICIRLSDSLVESTQCESKPSQLISGPSPLSSTVHNAGLHRFTGWKNEAGNLDNPNAHDIRCDGITSDLLWSPYVIGQTIIFSSCFFLSSSFFSLA